MVTMTRRSKRILLAALLKTIKGQVQIPDSGAIRPQIRQRCAAFYAIAVEPPLEILHHLRLEHRRQMRAFRHVWHFKPRAISRGCHQMSHTNVEGGRLHLMSSRLRGRHDDSALADRPMMRPGRLLSGVGGGARSDSRSCVGLRCAVGERLWCQQTGQHFAAESSCTEENSTSV